MGNIISKPGSDGLQVILYELDSGIEVVLGSERSTEFKHMVISPEEITIPLGRDRTYTEQQLE